MNLPEDIIVEILCSLPVKSLIRFKCVSQLWKSLIINKTFITTHINKKRNGSLLISHRDNITKKRIVSLLNDDEKLHAFEDENLPPILNHMLGLPPILNDTFAHIRLIGPCHGLVCLYGFPDYIVLWNPSMREFEVLPRSTIPRPPDSMVRGGDIGIGFDSTINDYKVIQILFCRYAQVHGFVYQVEIYSLLTNSWRKYEYSKVPSNIMYMNTWSMVYKNETFCWWAEDGNVEVILSFDMCKEVFKNTPLPIDIGELGGNHKIVRAILPLDESIALIVYKLKDVLKCFDIWVLNDLENTKMSWKKISGIGPILEVERPLGFLNHGEIIIVESSRKELVLYDPCRHGIKNLGMYAKRDRLEVIIYKESLVSVNSCKIK